MVQRLYRKRRGTSRRGWARPIGTFGSGLYTGPSGSGLYTGPSGSGLYSGSGRFRLRLPHISKHTLRAGWRDFIHNPAIRRIGSQLSNVGEKLSSALINTVGNKGEGEINNMFGSGLYTGSGNYNTNNLISGQASGSLSRNSIPKFSGKRDETGSITVSHREYVQDVYGPGVAGGPPTAFSLQAFPLNPGLQNMVPWLSQIACNFDEYEFKQLIWHYRSTTTDIGNSTNGQCGTVVMATNYNAAAPVFTDKQQMIEYAHSHSSKVTESMSHGVECARSKTAFPVLYTRGNPVVTGQDLKTYDHGKFQFAVCNAPSAYNGFPLGELWVEYTVMLRKPKLFTTRGFEIDRDTFTVFGGQATSSLILSNSTNNLLRGQQNNIGCAIDFAVSANHTVGIMAGVVATDSMPVAYSNSGIAVHLTIPAQYTGNLRIVYQYASSVGSTTTNPYLGPGFIASGNIIPINDLYGSSNASTPIEQFFLNYNTNNYVGPAGLGLPGGLNPLASVSGQDPSFRTDNSQSTSLEVSASVLAGYSEFHIYVSQSTSGVNNEIWLISNMSGSGTVGQGSIVVEQYQANQVTTSLGRVQYINSSGVVIQP